MELQTIQVYNHDQWRNHSHCAWKSHADTSHDRVMTAQERRLEQESEEVRTAEITSCLSCGYGAGL